MGIKNIYYSLEDKWYGFLDSLDKKGIPVYKIIDPIDRIIPSFALFLILLFAGILLLIAPYLNIKIGGKTEVTLSVIDEQTTQPISDAEIKVFLGRKLITSGETNENGKYTFEAEKNKTYVVKIKKEGYEQRSRTIFVKDKEGETIETPITLTPIPSKKTVKFYITDNSGGAMLKKPVSLFFSCSNPGVSAPEPIYNTTQKEISVEVDPNCGTLLVSINSDDYSPIASFAVDDGTTITLEEKEEQNPGKIVVSVKNEENERIEGINVYLYDSEENLFDQMETDEDGQAIFENVPPGVYVLKTYDPKGNYSEEESDPITLNEGETKHTTLILEENIAGYIKVKVVNDENNTLLDARVVLSDENGEIIGEDTTSEEKPVITFAVKEDKEYKISIYKEGYADVTQTVRISESTYIFTLERLSNVTTYLRIKVVDENNVPVENAKVFLYNYDTQTGKSYLSAYPPKITDVNGIAEFENVSEGYYLAKVAKFQSMGKSDPFYYLPTTKRDEIQATATMIIPKGILTVRVVDETTNKPVNFVKVTVYDPNTGQPARDFTAKYSDLTDTNGTVSFEIRSDKKVYVVIEDPSNQYISYTSNPVSLIPNGEKYVEFYLKKKPLAGELKVEISGVYNENNERIENIKGTYNLTPGKDYWVEFRIQTPTRETYKKVGLIVKTGEFSIYQKDPLYILEGSASTPNIMIGEKYTGNYEDDRTSITGIEGKWILMEWIWPKKGYIQARVKIRIKETAKATDLLSIYYKAYGVKEDDYYEDDPRTNSTTIEDIWASKYHKEIFKTGVDVVCEENFCYSFSLLDPEEELESTINEGVGNVEIMKDYVLSFYICNNSERIHNNATIRISDETETIWIKEWNIFNANAEPNEGTNTFALPKINLGMFEKDDCINGEMTIKAVNEGSGSLKFKVVSDRRVVFEKTITLSVISKNKMEVEVNPKTIYAGHRNPTLTVMVKDEKTGTPINDALVKAYLKYDKYPNSIGETRTENGEATIEITLSSGLSPGGTIYIEVLKKGYAKAKVEIPIVKEKIDITPNSISETFQVGGETQKTRKIKIKNGMDFPLTITTVDFIIDDPNTYVAKNIINEFLDGYEGKERIPANGEGEILIPIGLSENATTIEEIKTLNGKIVLVLASGISEWRYEIPVKIIITPGTAIEDLSCFSVNISSWKASTTGERISKKVIITNNCQTNGTFVKLKNLSAKIIWNGEVLGRFYLAGENGEIEIKSGYSKVLKSMIEREETIPLNLVFVPGTGPINGKSKAKIVFTAEYPTKEGIQKLETSVDVDLSVINLKSCISVDPENVESVVGEKASINITNGCNEEVYAKISDPTNALEINKKEIRLSPNASEKIEVEAKYPGEYGLEIRIRKRGQASWEELKVGKDMVSILFKPPEDSCISLSSYEFDLYQKPDYMQITNKCYRTIVDENHSVDIRFVTGTGCKNLTNAQIEKQIRKYIENGEICNTNEITVCRNVFSYLLEAFASGLLTYSGEKIKIKISSKEKKEQEKEEENKKNNSGSSGGYKPANASSNGNNIINGTIKIRLDGNIYYAEFNTTIPVTCDGETANKYKTTHNIKVGSKHEGIYKKVVCRDKDDKPYDIYLPKISGSDVLKKKCEILKFEGASSSQTTTVTNTTSVIETIKSFFSGDFSTGVYNTAMLYLLQNGAGLSQPSGLSTYLPGMASMFLSKFGWVGAVAQGILTGGMAYISDKTHYESTTLVFVCPRERDVLIINPEEIYITENSPKVAAFEETNPADNPEMSILETFEERNEKGITQYINVKFETSGLDSPVRFYTLIIRGQDGKKYLFSLRFNYITPGKEKIKPVALFECKLGEKEGVTGEEARKYLKVSYVWNWNKVVSNSRTLPTFCEKYYCDATQFTEVVIDKIHELDKLLEDLTADNWACPNAGGIYPINVSREIPLNYVGVEKERIELKRDGELKMELTLKANIEDISSACEEREIIINPETKITCSTPGGVVTKEFDYNYTTTAREIMNGNDKIEEIMASNFGTEIGIGNCEITSKVEVKWADENSNSNCGLGLISIEERTNSFKYYPNSCTVPRDTDYIEDWLKENGFENYVGKFRNLLEFKALLMKDGFTEDFQRDLAYALKNYSFLSSPSWLIDPRAAEGKEWLTLIASPEYLEFKPKYRERPPFGYILNLPGEYKVNIRIRFDDYNSNWHIFNTEGKPKVKVEVNLELLNSSQERGEDSPLYYMPIDGIVGLENGSLNRNGYGVNFTGDKIILTNEDLTIETQTSPSSNALTTVNVKDEKDPVKTNLTKRGTVVEVRKEGNKLFLERTLSDALLIGLKISRTTDSTPYVLYNIAVNGNPVKGLESLLYWNAFPEEREMCKDFEGFYVDEIYVEKPDYYVESEEFKKSGGIIPAASWPNAYGLAWANAELKGNLYLWSIFFAPKDTSPTFNILSYKDEAESEEKRVELNGKTLNELINLVNERMLCIGNYGSRIEFFWNPVKVFYEDYEEKIWRIYPNKEPTHNCITE